MVDTYSGNVNNQFAKSFAPYASKYGLNPAQHNAAKHAIASAVYSEKYGTTVASFLGSALETFHAQNDSYRDYVNNAIGRAIQEAYPGRTSQEYHDVIAQLSAKGFLYTPTGRYGRMTPEEVAFNLAKRAFREVEQRSLFDSVVAECFLEGTMIDMWPNGPNFKPDEYCTYDDREVLAKIWQKPIEEITPDDSVVSYDKNGNLVPGKVKRTFQKHAKHILDVHGLMMTPGHVTWCAKVEGEDNPFADRHVPILDILRSDGALMKEDGTLVRASTGGTVGSFEDTKIWAITGQKHGKAITVADKGRIRLGTHFIMDDGKVLSVLDMIANMGAMLNQEGALVSSPSYKVGTIFHWEHTPMLPKSEDYVLQRSAVTLDEIYSANEWEGERPHMPAPYRGEGGASFIDKPQVWQTNNPANALPPNIPLSMRGSPNQPTMNRQQRRALKRKHAKQLRRVKALN